MTNSLTFSLRHDIWRTLVLALPIAGAQLAQIALQVVDNMMCGRLGAEALAGVGLGSAVLAALLLPLLGIVGIISAFISESEGQTSAHEAPEAPRRYFQHGLLLAVLLGLPATLLLSLAPRALLAMGQKAELVSLASAYLGSVRWCLVPALLLGALKTCLDSVSRPQAGFWVALSGIGFNILANQILMFGGIGSFQWFEGFGVTGTGWATTLTNLWMLLILAFYFQRSQVLRRYGFFKSAGFAPGTLRLLLGTGWPVGVAILSEVGLFAGMTLFMGYLGEAALAAHQIALNVASLTFMCALGVAYATTVRVGKAMGEKDPMGARRAGFIGMGLGMALMGCAGVVFWSVPEWIMGLYLDLRAPENQAVLTLGAQLLRLAALFQLFDALQVTSQGGLRGLKDTFIPMVIGFCCYWLIGLGSGLWLGFGLQQGATGLWMGLVLGLMSAGVMLSARFFSFFKKADMIKT